MRLLLLALVLLLFSTKVLALGIASDYLENNTMLVSPGEQRTYGIRLQNPEPRNITVILKVESDSDIARLRDAREEYVLPPSSYSNAFTFDISIPADAVPGQTYRVSYALQPAGGSGAVPIGVRIEKSFTVKVSGIVPSDTSAAPSYPPALAAAGGIALLAGAVLLLRIRRR